MLRVLQVINGMDCGGAEMLLMNLYRHMDRAKIQFDFVVHTEKECMYDKEILELGGIIYHCPKFNGRNYCLYKHWWKEFLEEHPEHLIVHGHIGSSASIYLYEAKKQGRYTIAHSHSTKDVSKSFRAFAWRFFSYPTRYIADYYLACSKEAGLDRYGKGIVDSDKFMVLKNAIDCNRFKFSEDIRNEMRKTLDVENNFVIGHVGRFSTPKNHTFLVEIFEKIHEIDNTARLLLLGDGPLKQKIMNICHQKSIEDCVIFAGIQTNTQDYYMAMDVFCFPSKYEGLGIAAVEAQTAGLQVVASEAVPNLADIGANKFKVMSLEKTARTWAETLLAYKDTLHSSDSSDFAYEAGYDINNEAKKAQNFYLAHI